ncbi:DUF2206 domain-containing protein [Halosimplex amylolyticum]|uniref:DUF2206 domain-containing protein n=1 Tax=Halosimplex amylolyticum TaxID=3396616 RepID=UPI003F5762A1
MTAKTITIDARRVVVFSAAIQALLMIVLAVDEAAVDLSLLRPFVATIYLMWVPGLLIAVKLELDNSAAALAGYATGLSMVVIMSIGGIASVALPLVTSIRPMAPFPLAVLLSAVVAGLSFEVWRSKPRFEVLLPWSSALSPLPLSLVLLPFVSVLGTVYMKSAGSNLLLLILLVCIAFLPAVLVWHNETQRWYALAVWAVASALLYHGGLWPLTAGHQLSTITVEQGRWVPNYGESIGSLLPNGVLYPAYAQLGDIPLEVEFELINPLLISLLPVVLFVAYRQQTEARKALVAACLFMFSFPFMTLYPVGGRVSTPVFFLALTGLAISDDIEFTGVKRVLLLLFGGGIAVSHYGTAWVVMLAFFLSSLFFIALRAVDTIRPGNARDSIRSRATDGGFVIAQRGVLHWTFTSFYTVFAFAWYLYTGNGGKFKTLPYHVIGGINDILYQNDLTGDAARSVSKDYGSVSISTARLFFLVFGGLMALGIVAVTWQRVVRERRVVEDDFLALGAGFLAILGTAFLPFSSGFNTARVMMIVFTFSAPFVVFGTDELASKVSKGLELIRQRDSKSLSKQLAGRSSRHGVTRATTVALTLALAVFLLLNAGVVAELVTKGYAPSNQVSNDRLLQSEDPIERSKATGCLECNVQTHVWTLNHRATGKAVYGDDLAVAQIDYYRGRITAQVRGSPSGAFYTSLWSARNGTTSEGYLVFLHHNTDTESVFVTGKYDWRRFSRSKPVIQRSQEIYSTGATEIYLSRGDDTTERHTES